MAPAAGFACDGTMSGKSLYRVAEKGSSSRENSVLPASCGFEGRYVETGNGESFTNPLTLAKTWKRQLYMKPGTAAAVDMFRCRQTAKDGRMGGGRR